MSILNEDQKTEARVLLGSDVLKNVDQKARLAATYSHLVSATPICTTFVKDMKVSVQVMVELAQLDEEINDVEFDVDEWNGALEAVGALQMPSENYRPTARDGTVFQFIGSHYLGIGRGIAQGATVAGVLLGGTWLITKALRS